MMRTPLGETRGVRAELTRRAVADVVRTRLFLRRQQQTDLVRRTGISRSFIRAILRAEKTMSLGLFLELSQGLGVNDPCELLRDILNQRDVLRAAGSLTASAEELPRLLVAGAIERQRDNFQLKGK